MGKYIKLFETHAAYNAYINGNDKLLPNVSYCENENEVHYNPFVISRVVTAVFNIPTTANPISLTYENGWNDIESILVTAPNGSTFELSYDDLVEYDSFLGVDPFMAYQFDAIGNYTFEYTFKPNVDTINLDLFSGILYITSMTIPNCITSIGNYAFSNCTGLTNVTIPNSVTSIGDDAFFGCYFTSSNFIFNSSLDEVSNNYWGANIVDSDTDGLCIKDNSVIRYRSTSNSVTIPNSVTSIGNYAFSNCTGLTNVTIPNSVTSIGIAAFSNCTGLTSVTIPNSVITIGANAFLNCSSLTSVTIEATTPPTLDVDASLVFPNNNCPIYVPSASVETYKAATNWSSLASRIQAIA